MVSHEQTRSIRIGFMPFYVPFYESICADFPAEKLDIAEQCANTLSKHGDIVWNGSLVDDVDSANKAGAWMVGKEVDCVVAVTTIAVFSGIPYAALKQLKVPLLIWNAQIVRDVSGPFTLVDAVRNTTQIGTQALCNTLLRHGMPYRVITGYMKSQRTKTALARYFRIIGAVASVRRARLLDLGGTIPLMDDLLIDDQTLKKELGATVSHVDHQSLTDVYNRVSESSVRDHVVALKYKYAIDGLSTAELERSARLAEAFEEIVQEHRADAGTFNCQGQNCRFNPQIGITACYSLGVQNSRGKPFTCTGDLPTALAMLICKRLTGVSLYTEVQLMDEQQQGVVLLNTGEGEEAISRSQHKITITGNALFIGENGRGASYCYSLQPGPATIVSLTPTPHDSKSFRLIVAEGEILDKRLTDTRTIAGLFRFTGNDLHESYTRWLESGPVHHACTTVGHVADELREVADHLNMSFSGVTA